MVAEIVGGLLSGSLALLADAGHMAIDTAAMALSLFALWIARKPPTAEKTFGYYRVEILAALINGAMLIAVSVWIFYEAVNRFHSPHEIKAELMGWVAAGGLLINLLGLFLVHQHSRSDLNFRGVWLHLLTDTLGSVGSLIAAFLIVKWKWMMADPIISIFIALFILYGSWKLLMECVNVLLEGVPTGMDVNEIRNGLESFPAVDEVHDLHVWTVTSGVPALSAHVRVKEHVDYSQALQAVIDLLKKDYNIEHVTLQLEPTVFDHTEDAGIYHP